MPSIPSSIALGGNEAFLADLLLAYMMRLRMCTFRNGGEITEDYVYETSEPADPGGNQAGMSWE